jgi:hypothetical protein
LQQVTELVKITRKTGNVFVLVDADRFEKKQWSKSVQSQAKRVN